MSGFLSIIIFFVVIVITAMVFFIWLIVGGVRLVTGLIGSVFAPNRSPRMMSARSIPTIRCPTHGCQAINPSDARFCRRCGRGLPGAQRVQVRRAAVW
jgi:hypothetical protein